MSIYISYHFLYQCFKILRLLLLKYKNNFDFYDKTYKIIFLNTCFTFRMLLKIMNMNVKHILLFKFYLSMMLNMLQHLLIISHFLFAFSYCLFEFKKKLEFNF